MTKPADDKLGHAKREIKALKLKLESCSRFASQHLGKIERLEVLVESCSKRNESDCDLIDSLQEQVAELEASAVTPKGYKLVSIKPTRNMIDAAHDSGYIDHYEAEITWEIMVAAAQEPPKQEPAE
jgi:hypothetical protein